MNSTQLPPPRRTIRQVILLLLMVLGPSASGIGFVLWQRPLVRQIDETLNRYHRESSRETTASLEHLSSLELEFTDALLRSSTGAVLPVGASRRSTIQIIEFHLSLMVGEFDALAAAHRVWGPAEIAPVQRVQTEWRLFQDQIRQATLTEANDVEEFRRLTDPLQRSLSQLRSLHRNGIETLSAQLDETRSATTNHLLLLFGALMLAGSLGAWQILKAGDRLVEAERHTQDVIRASEERFALAVAGTNEGIWDWNIVTGEDHFSERWCKLLGYRPDELSPTVYTWNVHVHPDDRLPVMEAIQRHLEDREPYDMEYRLRTKSGEYRWFRSRGQAVWDDEGRPVRMVGSTADVTETRASLNSRLQLAAIVDVSTDAIVSARKDGTIASWNGAAEVLFGYTEEEALGMSAARLFPPERANELARNLDAVKQNQVVTYPDTVRLRKDGRRVEVSIAGYLLRDSGGNVIGGGAIMRDISEQKRLEQRFQEAQRMEAVGRVAAGVAHDFNNLMTIVGGQSALIKDELPEDSPLRQKLGSVERAVERGATLTGQLLAFSRKQRAELRVMDLNDLLREVLSMLGRTIREDISLRTSLKSSWCVKADPAQLEQVILNLVTNARDAMPHGGKLSIETSDVVREGEETSGERDGNWYSPERIPPGSYVQLKVTDTGVGLNRDALAQAFEPFYTTKERGKGTGLGLPAVYGVVAQAGGSVSVESEVNHGSSFYVYLPRVAGVVENPEIVQKETPGLSRGTILLVEDDAEILDLATLILKKGGYTVLSAAKPRDALDHYSGESIDLIVTDVVMPEMSGPSFAKEWEKQDPTIKVLYMSGYIDESVGHLSIPEGDIITKPFSPPKLLQAVARRFTHSPSS